MFIFEQISSISSSSTRLKMNKEKICSHIKNFLKWHLSDVVPGGRKADKSHSLSAKNGKKDLFLEQYGIHWFGSVIELISFYIFCKLPTELLEEKIWKEILFLKRKAEKRKIIRGKKTKENIDEIFVVNLCNMFRGQHIPEGHKYC